MMEYRSILEESGVVLYPRLESDGYIILGTDIGLYESIQAVIYLDKYTSDIFFGENPFQTVIPPSTQRV